MSSIVGIIGLLLIAEVPFGIAFAYLGTTHQLAAFEGWLKTLSPRYSKNEIAKKIAKIQASLEDNCEELVEIQDDMKKQIKLAEELAAKVKENENILSLTEEQSEVFYKAIGKELQRGNRRSLALNILLGVIFMLGGVVLGQLLPKLF